MLLLVEFWLTAWAAVRLSENKKAWWKALLPVGIGFVVALLLGTLLSVETVLVVGLFVDLVIIVALVVMISANKPAVV